MNLLCLLEVNWNVCRKVTSQMSFNRASSQSNGLLAVLDWTESHKPRSMWGVLTLRTILRALAVLKSARFGMHLDSQSTWGGFCSGKERSFFGEAFNFQDGLWKWLLMVVADRTLRLEDHQIMLILSAALKTMACAATGKCRKIENGSAFRNGSFKCSIMAIWVIAGCDLSQSYSAVSMKWKTYFKCSLFCFIFLFLFLEKLHLKMCNIDTEM